MDLNTIPIEVLFESHPFSSLAVYQYIPKDMLPSVKKNGLLSLYGLYKLEMKDQFRTAAEKYLGRQKKKLNIDDVVEDPTEFFKLYQQLNGKDAHKAIWFSMKPITPGISKNRDAYAKRKHLFKLPVSKLKKDWTYYGVEFPGMGYDWKRISYDQMIDALQNMDMEKTERENNHPKLLFKGIPHLAICPPEGIIKI